MARAILAILLRTPEVRQATISGLRVVVDFPTLRHDEDSLIIQTIDLLPAVSLLDTSDEFV
jgi:hypothetical protein